MLYRKGSTGSTVRKIQRQVGVTADGIYGPKTVSAVKSWQAAHHLSADGIVGPKTYSAMFHAKPKRKGPLAGRRIVIDIGHGWHNRKRGVFDPGAVAGKALEHLWAERYGEALAQLCKKRGATVLIIEDKALRFRKAAKSDTAVSIHFNAGGGTGVEVLVPILASSKAVAHARRVGAALALAQGLTWRGVKRRRGLAVFSSGFDMLIEVAFIDNKYDREKHEQHFAAAVDAVADNI